MIDGFEIGETAEEMMTRIKSRDQRMKDDLKVNYSGNVWFTQKDGVKND